MIRHIQRTGTEIAVYGVLGKMDPPTVPHITTYDLDSLSKNIRAITTSQSTIETAEVVGVT